MSILFADLVGSTGLHERLDPESARRFMESYYAAAREAVESHGGTVTQFLGDGVKAVFGIPRVAEDDAIRAVRAGVAMQDAFRALAEQQRAAVGETGLRVAVNTGEVVAKGETEIIGDPVNVAARLQERGRDGDVVIGESTQRLVATQVSLELLGTFALKGRAEAVKAYRVLSIAAPQRAAATAFVGRVEELARITAVYDRAVRMPAAHLAVLLGSPGLGKSRLIGEFARRCGDTATVVAAHCDAAGGATFAPIADALRELLSIETGASADSMRAAVEAALPEEETERKRIAAGISGLLTGATGSPEETFFVVRRFLAGLAAPRPVVLAIDDLQWAEPLLIDLVEHLVQWGRGLPLLVLIGARPELREVRSSMAIQGGLVSDVLSLDGLDATAAMRVAAGVIGATDLPAAVAAKVLATSEGNPLFIGELVRMLVDEGALIRDADRWKVGEALATVEMPPTIHALLAARIERLAPAECAALERAAVVGRHFSRSAVAALLPNASAGLDAQLESLQRADLIERDTGWFLGEPVLRFHHVLIRDAAYRRLLKGTRAELHERLANWIEGRVGDAPEHDETIGRHLEEAHRLLGELGPLDEAGQFLGERAATRLASAGRRALEGDDVPLAAGLLGRALDRLAADDVGRPGQPPEALARRAGLALDWCEALLAAGDVANAGVAIEELGRMTADSERLRAWHTCFVGHHTVLTAPKELSATVEQVAAAASTLASLDDAAGEAKGHFVHALALSRLGQVGACEASLDRALAAARRAGDRRRANTVLAIAPLAALWGPSPVTRASGRCLDVVRVLRITQGAPAVEAVALSCQGVLEALRGRTEAALRMIASGREMVEELGIAQRLFEADVFAGFVAMLEGDALTAEQTLRGAYGGLRELGLGIDAARAAAMLARAVLAQHRIEEAETLSHESEALAGDDLKAAIAWRGVRAEVLARRGQLEEAVALARAGAAIAASTDALLDHADARRALAAVLRAAGESLEADEEDRRARELWEAKGATVLAEQRKGGAGVKAQAAPTLPERRGGWRGSAARVRSNRAIRVVAQLADALADGKFEAARGFYADTYTEVYNRTGAVLDAAGSVGGVELLRRSQGAFFEASGVATLGDSFVLVNRRSGASGTGGQRYDVGPYENDGLHLVEVGADGLLNRAEEFVSDRLSDAVARLYEWYAEAMPSGPEAAGASRTARAVRAWHSSTAMDELGFEAIHPAIEMVDHRRPGTWRASGLPAVLEQIESLRQVVTDFELRDEEILALAPTALLRRQVNVGVERVGGGVYEREYLVIHGFADDGRMNLQECFDVGDEARAFSRFDELTKWCNRDAPTASATSGKIQSTQVVQRRVRPNAASAVIAQIEAAFQARDLDTIGALHNGEMEIIDHPHGSTYGLDGVVETFERMLRSPRIEFRFEALATLGESLYLGRRWVAGHGTSGGRFDVAEYEMDHIVLTEADEQGRLRWSEVFASDHLGDAIHRLYERYAELMAEGPARDCAATAARVVRASLMLDVDPEESLLVPDIEAVDHRNLGLWSAVGAEEVRRHFSALSDVASDAVVRIEDILALEPTAFLDRRLHAGKERAGGGIYERPYCLLGAFAPDGRLRRSELFDVGDEARALARFEQLTRSPGEASVADAKLRCPVPRCVLPNAASAAAARLEEIFAAGDASAIGAVLDDRLEAIDHRWHATYGRDGVLESWRRMMRPQGAAYRSESIATLGEWLGLSRRIHTAPASTAGRFDVGERATDYFTVAQVDGSGLYQRLEFFAADHLGDAVARLYELYAELLPEGPLRDRAVTTAHAAAFMLTQALDYPAQDVMAPDLKAVDHRLVGYELVELGSRWGDSWEELATDLTFHITDVLALSEDALLRSTTAAGFWKLGGGAFETSYYALSIFGPDGRQARVEFFDVGHEMQALARFDAISGHGSDQPESTAGAVADGTAPLAARSRVWNRADALCGILIDAFHARDWPAFEGMLQEDFRFADRRPLILLDLDRDAWINMTRRFGDMDSARLSVETIATRGQRLALLHIRADMAGGDVGPSLVEHVNLFEANEACDRLVWAARFEVTDIAAAYAELDARYEAGEGAAPSKNWLSISGFVRAVERRDWDAVRALCRDDFVEQDHRGLAVLGETESADAWVANFRTLVDLAPDTVYRAHHVLEAERGYFVHGSWYGTREGGPYELQVNAVLELDEAGRMRRADIYDDGVADAALARLAELKSASALGSRQDTAPTSGDGRPRTEPSATFFANSAVRAMRRVVVAQTARDMEAVAATFAEEFRAFDRRALLHTEATREKFLEAYRPDVEMTSEPPVGTVLATRGDRLALFRWLWRGGGGNVGPSEIDKLNLIEVNDRGEHIAIVTFDTTDVDAAYAELDARYEAEHGDRLPASWTLLRRWARAVAERDWQAVASTCADGFVEHDHRSLSPLGVTHGIESWVQVIRTVSDLAPDSVFRIHHFIPGARGYFEGGGFCGTREGGPFEIVINALVEVDEKNLLARVDTYDDDRVFASPRWSELGIPVPGTAREPSARKPPGPTIAERNAASVGVDRWLETYRAGAETGNWEPMREVCAPDVEYGDRRRLVLLEGGVEMLLASVRERAASGATVDLTRVGTAGDRVEIARVLWSGGPDDGRFEIEYLAVAEVDESGRIAAFVLFDLEDARAAQREAWRRWAAMEPDVAAVVKPIGDLLDAFSAKSAARFRAALADDLVVEDHRLAGMGRLEGADAYTESVAALWAIAPESRLDLGWRWAAVDHHGAITVALRTGTVPGGGGNFESECLYLYHVADGRLTRSELLEMDALDNALARFEALRGSPPGPDPLRIPPNQAVGATERLDQAFVANDLSAVRALFHPQFVFEDRGKKALVKGDVETLIESAQYLLSLPRVRLDLPLLATMGDRIALQHEVWSGGADRDGFFLERLRYVEVDANGLFRTWILFDSEDRDAAFAEAQQCFVAGEAAGCRTQGLLHNLHIAWGTQDWEALRASIADDAVVDDYRPLGLGKLGRDGWIESWRFGADMAPDVRLEVLRILIWNEHGRVQLSRVFGTRDGGEFENVLLNLFVWDGELLRYHEFYDVQDAGRAVARFEELCSLKPEWQSAARTS